MTKHRQSIAGGFRPMIIGQRVQRCAGLFYALRCLLLDLVNFSLAIRHCAYVYRHPVVV